MFGWLESGWTGSYPSWWWKCDHVPGTERDCLYCWRSQPFASQYAYYQQLPANQAPACHGQAPPYGKPGANQEPPYRLPANQRVHQQFPAYQQYPYGTAPLPKRPAGIYTTKFYDFFCKQRFLFLWTYFYQSTRILQFFVWLYAPAMPAFC